MKKILLIVAVSLVFLPFKSGYSQNEKQDEAKGIEYLVAMMEGSYSSEEQSKSDTSYFDILLHMKRMWKDKTGEAWLYVEQAVASKQDKPYRQRVYRITQIDGKTFESAVFTIPDPLKYAGEWKNDNPLSGLSPKDIVSRGGCSVFLSLQDDGTFKGSTKDKNCESDLRNAKYATSEVTLRKDELISWDRGFNDKDEQVWGAVKGGYIFRKVKE